MSHLDWCLELLLSSCCSLRTVIVEVVSISQRSVRKMEASSRPSNRGGFNAGTQGQSHWRGWNRKERARLQEYQGAKGGVWAKALPSSRCSPWPLFAEGRAVPQSITQEAALLTMLLKTTCVPRQRELLCVELLSPTMVADLATAGGLTRRKEIVSFSS